MKRQLKLCFISLNSYPLFVDNHPGYFGGAELQISLIAKRLAKDRRFSISVVVGDYGQTDVVRSSGLILYKCFRKKWPTIIEVFRFFWILKKIDADVYIERILHPKAGLVCLFSKLLGKKFLYMAAHDWDTQPDHGYYLNPLEALIFDFGLNHADLIISQTEEQRKKLQKNFGLRSTLLRSSTQPLKTTPSMNRDFFLWVGRADAWKRPEIFIRLAKSLPRQNFLMICRQGKNEEFFLKIKSLAAKQTNLRFLPMVRLEEIGSYFRCAKALVNTSVAEGFPNTFLQAGEARTPIISYSVNPDRFIDQYRCGLWARSNFLALIKACQALNRKMGENNFDYVRKFHSLRNARLFGQILLNYRRRTAA